MDIKSLLTLILFLIFLSLSAIHVYWVFGGKWGLSASFPTKESGQTLVSFDNSLKTKIPTTLVAIGLLFFGLISLELGGKIQLLQERAPLAGYSIAGIFALRAIGDFNYLGLFKKVKATPFGIADTRLYVPLCLFISVSTFILSL